ncbi:MAG: aspartate/glutamate racemase family protein [Spirochaetes bacterium]|nr:MAG: aspartate/glutamate racemase family protein [Spirochaetota bacterium]
MRILTINPNTNISFNKALEKTAEKYALSTTTVKVISPDSGPQSIEGSYDEALSVTATVKTFLEHQTDYDGFIIACYSDHLSTYAIREITEKPVIGIAKASVMVACTLGDRFSIVTTNDRWKPLLREAVEKYGVRSRCASVRTTGMSVAALKEESEEVVREKIEREALAAIEKDGAEVICLGCAGMTGFDKELEKKTGVPVLDGFVCALKLIELYHQYGITHSKRRRYSAPLGKKLKGFSEIFLSAYKK